MYGVPKNTALQKISMSIYEDFNGVISSVCHGTAGIVNLKTKDGKYLVAGKRVSGYPEAYESTKATHIKQFPFLIQQTIEQRKGLFKVSKRGQAHIEVDGRLVTGQNYLSSALVAKQIIAILEKN
jgi:putative intracellular protease/amidase